MANTRRNRKNRSNNGVRVATYLYKPFGHALAAANETVSAVLNTGKGLVGTTARGANRVGKSVTGHLNMAVSDVIRPVTSVLKSRRNRRSTRRNRKNRRNTRRNRRNNY
jgi:hypothetical protein